VQVFGNKVVITLGAQWNGTAAEANLDWVYLSLGEYSQARTFAMPSCARDNGDLMSRR